MHEAGGGAVDGVELEEFGEEDFDLVAGRGVAAEGPADAGEVPEGWALE